MKDDKSEGGLAMSLAVNTGDVPIGEGFKLLEMFHELFKQDVTSMEDANDLFKEIDSSKARKGESAPAMVARFNAFNTKLKGKSTSIVFPDTFLQKRFLCALPTSGNKGYTEVLNQHHRGKFKTLADLQKAVVDEEIALIKRASFQSAGGAVAAAAHATDANLVPVSTKAEKRKAKRARRRTKVLAAQSESSSTSNDAAACVSTGSCTADADASSLRALALAPVRQRQAKLATLVVKPATSPPIARKTVLPLATRPKRSGAPTMASVCVPP
jgi:hypothetical protein